MEDLSALMQALDQVKSEESNQAQFNSNRIVETGESGQQPSLFQELKKDLEEKKLAMSLQHRIKPRKMKKIEKSKGYFDKVDIKDIKQKKAIKGSVQKISKK